MEVTNLPFYITFGPGGNLTFYNCIRYTGGGAAINITDSMVYLTNVIFANNTASRGPGGALLVSDSLLRMSGGAFLNNQANTTGGAVQLFSSIGRFGNGTLFYSNNVNWTKAEKDIACDESNLQNDGSVTFILGQAISCSITATSPSTAAAFPGSLNGLLFPNSISDDTNLFASINFISIAEVDSTTGQIVKGTQLVKQDLTWATTVQNSTNFTTFQYDAFSSKGQYIGFIHTFFTSAGYMFSPGVGDVFVPEGYIKTTILVGPWPFQSPQNFLSVSVAARPHSKVTDLIQQQTSWGDQTGTEFVLTTESGLVISFDAFSTAIEDSVTSQVPVVINSTSFPTQIMFEFVFPSFDLWLAYDPQFGVVLGPDPNAGDDTSTSLSLILGLSIGLTLGVLCVGFTVVLVTVATIWFMRFKQKRQMMSQVKAHEGGLKYAKLSDDEEDIATVDCTTNTATTNTTRHPFVWDAPRNSK